ncbi:zinc finger protein ZFPM1 isoform X4 [Pipistrellus kuhlii]|uniref:Zinc finger protein ZFPM1 n=1 Tax=Pipistrellus kuhlii TaxID=59472 RepID=A0A7J7V1S0_PIPKU|nr:zinc finger protein ZFPM1 isoform X4 [Pipistrellus kuhlii]KAF6319053.1 zinc finger protein, FOG family member 1 [Pipistrellus kuhlii]
MSRRKQSNPRQIKRSLGDMEAGEEAQAADIGLPEPEAAAPEPEAKEEPKPLSPSSPEANPLPPPPTPQPTSPEGSKEMEGQEPETSLEEESSSSWSGPDELEQVLQDGQRCVRARRSLAEGLSWGPFHGSIQSRASSPGQTEPSPALTLLLEDEACWLRTLPLALTEAEANVEIHRKDGALWCRLTKPVPAGGLLSVLLTAEPHSTPNHPVKKEPAEPECLAPSHTDIQLLPQQAGMASILATAVINKDVFPCKDCGIWYRSERNLQAHLLYYCASRQSAGSPAAAAADEKPKEPYPNERVCPFPQCRKSCPSASSLEIHMRSHSGERPFVCLICLSAFTTKANCERHLKVHTDTQSGVCHSCGFISTTRDILYSHLVTNHMVCQPGSKAEIYSPGVGHPSAKLPPDSLPGFQQLTALHGSLASSDLGLGSTSSPGLDRKALDEATNGEARTAPQNGGSSEPPTAPRSIKVEAAEEPEEEPGPPALSSRTPSPPSSAPVRVKAELPSPTPGSSPGPGALFLPQFPAAPPASEILAKMSELVHSRLQVGVGAGAPAGLLAGTPKGATCFECDITFNNVSNFYVHKRLYCSGRRAPDDVLPPARRPKAPPTPVRAAPAPPPAEPDKPSSSPGPGAREDLAGGATTPEAETGGGGRGSEGSPSPGSGADEDDDPRRTLCEACNIRFSRHETYMVHKRYYCASRHDPPPRRPAPAAPPGNPGIPAPALPPVRTRRRRKLYELQAASPAPAAPGPAQPSAAPAPETSASPSPRPGSGSGPDLSEGPIDLSKKPRRQTSAAPVPGPAPVLPALADYHECTACRVSFHSLEAYLAHKKFSCPAAPRRPRAPEDPAVVCPYCPPNGLVHGDLVEHLRLAHGLLLGKPLTGPGPGAEARTPSPAAPRDGLNGQEPPTGPADGSPRPGPPSAPPTPPSHSDKGVQTPSKGTPTSLPNGNHRYCRLCNIKFSSLSTFIAHKKYYCSSHAAEHVK